MPQLNCISGEEERMREIREKEARLWRWLETQELDGVMISKRSNFAWLTAGGGNHIILTSELGASSLLVTREGKRLLACRMDGDRTLAEEAARQGIEPYTHHWYDDRQALVTELTKGLRIGSDSPMPGLHYLPNTWRELFFPLLPPEVCRVRDLGRLANEAISEVCHAVAPGMTENQVAGLLAGAYARRGLLMDVLLVGSDERPYHYRHCLPTDKPIENHVLMHVAAQRWGLHANLTRLVHFGPLPDNLRRHHEAISYVHAAISANLLPEGRFVDILAAGKAAYASQGFAEEWREHYLGGVTGYDVAELLLVLDPTAIIRVNQTYNWLPTLPGTKIEELTLLTNGGPEFVSLDLEWPMLEVEYNGHAYRMPDILQR